MEIALHFLSNETAGSKRRPLQSEGIASLKQLSTEQVSSLEDLPSPPVKETSKKLWIPFFVLDTMVQRANSGDDSPHLGHRQQSKL